MLVEAGVSPVGAWSYLAGTAVGTERTRSSEAVIATVAGALERGAPLDLAIAAAARACDPRTRQAWSAVAAAWSVATVSGAPVSVCLRHFAAALVELGDIQRSIDVALSAPVLSARLMSALPVLGLALGTVLGFDTVSTLVSTLPGLVCLGSGAGLLLASRWWNSVLVASAMPSLSLPGITLELTAVALSGGVSLDRAGRVVAEALASNRLEDLGAQGRLDAVLDLSRRAGVPAAELLRAEGAQARRAALAVSQARAATLGVRLTVPMGVCVLPAFMLLGVAPLLLGVIATTLGSPGN
ncbi:pilus assembly protein TadB [Subtercola frigoramans]|uniref:Tight adherence protein B n=1 Tax=Subtercola frigoramans TaxID=120298 RepID=A0ABS2L8E7_9MICO|nr:pilus assembly protein TadB [Subtercola frigoramans]MBM7473368.1 tight adherence protein B [Subtercola frigoramans]